MNKSLVRCWRVKNYTAEGVDDLLITYPEENMGHSLITCTNCGKVYSVDVSKMVYKGPSLELALAKLNCMDCGKRLIETYALYPETYVACGKLISFERPKEIPPDAQSIVEGFDEIY